MKNPEGKKEQLGEIKMDLQEIGLESLGKGRRLASVNTAVKLRVP